MFNWQKEMERLDIPAKQVLKVMQSLSDVQVVLPGVPGQRACAYLCVYSLTKGVRVAVAFHLRDSRRLAFYLNDQGEIPQQKTEPVLKEGIHLAESMGFLLDELELPGQEAEREARWDSLPLRRGITPPEPHASRALSSAPPPVPEPKPDPETKPASAPSPTPLAAASGFHFSGGTLVPKKNPPTAAEINQKREALLKNLGRFLASL